MKKFLTLAAIALAFASIDASAQYYKDVFMDGGMYLSSKKDLPSTRYLGLSLECYYSTKTEEQTERDSIIQAALLTESDIDANGKLLYPDGAPRFRCVYVNGGKANPHGRSIGEKGRQNYRDFVAGGGSYVGTCAGAYLASTGSGAYDKACDENFDIKTAKAKDIKPYPNYLGVYPAPVIRTSQVGWTKTDMIIPEDSPLLKYYDFGGDFKIDSVRHNGGCCITAHPQHFVPGTEILAYYKCYDETERERLEKGKWRLSGKISMWAYKADENTGRVVCCGSHPESVNNGEQLQLFAAFLKYAMDGNGLPRVKGELLNGETREMRKTTADGDPAYTRIGDKQYHHFTVNIPEGAKNIKIELLSGENGFEECYLNLTLKKGDFAFRETADYIDVRHKGKKVSEFKTLEPGLYYIGVEGETTVDVKKTDHGEEYKGHTEVLNGVPYTITVSWE